VTPIPAPDPLVQTLVHLCRQHEAAILDDWVAAVHEEIPVYRRQAPADIRGRFQVGLGQILDSVATGDLTGQRAFVADVVKRRLRAGRTIDEYVQVFDILGGIMKRLFAIYAPLQAFDLGELYERRVALSLMLTRQASFEIWRESPPPPEPAGDGC